MTQIDGVETAEQFDFGPFNVQQFELDVDTLKSAEIVRSAAQHSTAATRSAGWSRSSPRIPRTTSPGRSFHVGAQDGRRRTLRERQRQHRRRRRQSRASRPRCLPATGAVTSHATRAPSRPRTPGARRSTRRTGGASRAWPRSPSASGSSNLLRAAFETNDNEVDTEAYSSRAARRTRRPTSTSVDTMERAGEARPIRRSSTAPG